jgi:hypothetical protein
LLPYPSRALSFDLLRLMRVAWANLSLGRSGQPQTQPIEIQPGLWFLARLAPSAYVIEGSELFEIYQGKIGRPTR